MNASQDVFEKKNKWYFNDTFFMRFATFHCFSLSTLNEKKKTSIRRIFIKILVFARKSFYSNVDNASLYSEEGEVGGWCCQPNVVAINLNINAKGMQLNKFSPLVQRCCCIWDKNVKEYSIFTWKIYLMLLQQKYRI